MTGVEIGLAAGLGACTGLSVLAGWRWCILNRAGRHVERISTEFRAWEQDHRLRSLKVADRTAEIEEANIGLQDASCLLHNDMRDLRYDWIHRLEAVEAHREIDLLVAQGRIPAEHNQAASLS